MAVMKRKCLNRDSIKYIGMLTMLLNHIANVFLESGTVLYELFLDIGYFTAITMCYFLVEGYHYTSSKRNYGLRLLVFGIISEIPFCLAFTENGILGYCGMNMMITLFLCFLIIVVMKGPDREGQWISGYIDLSRSEVRRFLVMVLVLLSVFCDWPVLAPLFTILFLEAEESEEMKKRAFLYGAASFGIVDFLSKMGRLAPAANLLATLGGMAAVGASGICIIYLYNGKQMERGKTFSKWFFYLFYPAHLLVLGLIRIYK